nr:biotin transporter BioY [Treponema vincentii]
MDDVHSRRTYSHCAAKCACSACRLAVGGPLFGGLSVLLFLVAGAVGLPVFSGGSGGFAVFAGPTGGFLVGYLAAAVVGGCIMKLYREEQRWPLACSIIAVAGLLSFFVYLRIRSSVV